MRKLVKVLAVAVFALVPFVGGSAASAATCEIGFTGPDSNNMCTSVTEYTCRVTNTNTVTIVNQNTQEATSGTVNVSGNGQGGNSTSGTVSNNNGTTFTVVITNSNPESEQPGICTASVVVPATPETPVQPTQGGGAAELPKTSGDMTMTVLIVTATSLAVLAGVGVAGVALYRYYKSL